MEQLALWDADFFSQIVDGIEETAKGEIRDLLAEKEGFEPSRPVYVDLRP